MRKTALLLVISAVAIVVAVAGCSDANQHSGGSSPRKGKVANKEDNRKPKTVVVNEGMSKKEEKKLNQRLDELEKKVNKQDEKGSQATASRTVETSQPEQSQAPQAEDQVRSAAVAYYQ